MGLKKFMHPQFAPRCAYPQSHINQPPTQLHSPIKRIILTSKFNNPQNPMPTISIAVQKGGSGKTTTAVNLAAALQQMGQRVLLIDVDPQSNLTHALGLGAEVLEGKDTIYEMLMRQAKGENADLEKIILTDTVVPLIPAGPQLASAEVDLASAFGREFFLRELLEPIADQYDYIFIDCPPSIGMLTVNALVASDGVLTPIQSEFLPLKGLRSFEAHRRKIQSRLNQKLELVGIVLSRYAGQMRMHRQIYYELMKEFGEKLFSTTIRTNIALAHAQQQGVDIFTYDKTSNGAEDYLALARELLQRVEAK